MALIDSTAIPPGDTGYNIDNSVKLERANSETLQFTFDQAATNLKKNTLSIWFKRTEISVNQGLYQFGDDASGEHSYIRFTSSDDKGFLRGNFGSNVQFLLTTQSFRDTASWYHLVVAWDTTQSTAANRLKIYLNGAEVTAFDTDNRSSVIPLNHDTPHGENGKSVLIGEGVYKISSYVAETHFIDGQALAPTEFGEIDQDTGIWIPKAYDGTYGNNGFYLDFKNSSNLGEDQSGNNHDFTLNNISAADQATDTPTNNFATLNNLLVSHNNLIATNGATLISGTNAWSGYKSTIGLRKGKWYWEIELATGGGNSDMIVGVQDDGSIARYDNADAHTVGYKYFLYYTAGGYRFYTNSSGNNVDDSSSTSISGIAEGDIIGIALNLDDNEISFYKNGSIFNSYEDLDLGALGTSSLYDGFVFPAFVNYSSLREQHVNFGGFTSSKPASAASDANGYGSFEYSPPSNYYSICSQNLALYG